MVKHIKYKEEKLPIRLSYSVIKRLQEEDSEIDLENLVGGKVSNYEPLLFYSLKSGFKAEDKEFKFDMKDMEDILDECFWDFVEVVPTFFPEQIMDQAKVQQNSNKLPAPKGKQQKK